MEALKLSKAPNFKYNFARVCSDHFDDGAIRCSGLPGNQKRLHPDAVPTLSPKKFIVPGSNKCCGNGIGLQTAVSAEKLPNSEHSSEMVSQNLQTAVSAEKLPNSEHSSKMVSQNVQNPAPSQSPTEPIFFQNKEPSFIDFRKVVLEMNTTATTSTDTVNDDISMISTEDASKSASTTSNQQNGIKVDNIPPKTTAKNVKSTNKRMAKRFVINSQKSRKVRFLVFQVIY